MHPTGLLAAEAHYKLIVNGQETYPPDLKIIPRQRLEHGDVVMTFTLDTDDPNPNVHPQIATTVGIDHILCRNLIGTSVLNQIRSDAGTAIDVIDALIHPD